MIDATDHKACQDWYAEWLNSIESTRANDRSSVLWHDLMVMSGNMSKKWKASENARIEARRKRSWTRVQRYMDEMVRDAEEYQLLIFEAIMRC
jgi:hypothetical protein